MSSNILDFHIEQGATFKKNVFIESTVPVNEQTWSSSITHQNDKDFSFDIVPETANNYLKVKMPKTETANLTEGKSRYEIRYVNNVSGEETILLRGNIYLSKGVV